MQPSQTPELTPSLRPEPEAVAPTASSKKRVYYLYAIGLFGVCVIVGAIYLFNASYTWQFAYLRNLHWPSSMKVQSYTQDSSETIPARFMCLDAPCSTHNGATLTYNPHQTVTDAIDELTAGLASQGITKISQQKIYDPYEYPTDQLKPDGTHVLAKTDMYHYDLYYKVNQHRAPHCPYLRVWTRRQETAHLLDTDYIAHDNGNLLFVYCAETLIPLMPRAQ